MIGIINPLPSLYVSAHLAINVFSLSILLQESIPNLHLRVLNLPINWSSSGLTTSLL